MVPVWFLKFILLVLVPSTSQYFHVIFTFLVVYFIPLLIPGKVRGDRMSLLAYACSLPLSPLPASAQAFCEAATFNGLYSA